jgi:phenylacetate-coenzyme A ligase PaaK-like adenylate-forming protein
MGIKAALSKPFAKFISLRMNRWKTNAPALQEKVFQYLIRNAMDTAFGRDHRFSEIKTYEDFKALVPVRDYEDLRPYIDRLLKGERDVLWKGKPIYFAKTSGTTSGVKFIPITRASIPHHIHSARNALLMYIEETGKADFVDGQMMFISGSPELDKISGIYTGRLSGIVNHHVPKYLQSNNMPSYETNCIEDWEEKVDAIVEETLNENMTLISGIPPWVQMYFDKLRERTGKKIKDIFPNFSLFVYGGVNFEPYRAKLEESIGKRVDSIELYPASEGFIAFQDSQTEPGLLLTVDAGIFYEFIPADEYFDEHPTRIRLQDVELNKHYAIILNTNAGLWGYSLGDKVKFVSKDPYRLVVTGRLKHFISAFGEHVIAEEVEYALLSVANKTGVEIVEFTVAPQVTPPEGGLPYHEWFVEFAKEPADRDAFRKEVDRVLQEKNTYYFDLIDGHILQPLQLRSLRKGAFIDYMRSKGRLGGQNKVPRLANDRHIADELEQYIKV